MKISGNLPEKLISMVCIPLALTSSQAWYLHYQINNSTHNVDTTTKSMAQISLGGLQTLFLTIAPFLIPYLIRTYRSLRGQAHANLPARRPVPLAIRRYTLNILFAAATLAFISTLPPFTPENILARTSSRIQIPANVLWERVAALRPNRSLTELDEKLRSRLVTVDARCFYLVYGPDVVGNCPFCNSDEPSSYFYYAVPTILFPHLLNLAALGLSTSSAIAGKEGSRWRLHVTILGTILALGELFMYYTYDRKVNARATRSEDLFPFHWKMRLAQGLGLAIVDISFAGLLWLTSTNRLFVAPLTAAERLDHAIRQLETTSGKLTAVGVVRNATVRNQNLRNANDAYWKREGDVMEEVMAEREVVNDMRGALSSGRINLPRVEKEAGLYADNIIDAQSLRSSGSS